MGQLVFQATAGGQVSLSGPNTASTYILNVPAVSATLATTAANTFTADQSINGLTVGLGGGAVASNTVVGYQAGYTNSTGTNNLYIGKQAGYNATGSGNTFVGPNGCGSVISTGSKNTIIGAFNGYTGLDITTASNYIVLSDGDGNPRVSIPTGTATATIPNVTGTVMVSGNMPAFSAYNTTGQSVTANTNTKIQLNVKNFDTNNNFDSTTNYRFTPTVAGYYQINGTVMLANTVGTVYSIIYKNGSEWIRGSLATAIATSYTQSSASSLIYLNGSTDYVELYTWFSATSTVGPQNNYTQFSGSLVRGA
jgi:hypothetical protein